MQKSTPSDNDMTAHVDPSVLDRIGEQMQANPDIVPRIIGSFLRFTPVTLNELRIALLANDPEAIRKAAHTMKSSNAQVGANQLAAMCHQLEILGSKGQVPDSAGRLHELEKEYQAVEKELGQMLARLSGQGGR